MEQEIATRTCNPVVEMDCDGDIIRKKIRAYPQGREVRILTFQEDIGSIRTYNEGLGKATGELCTYIVGDDQPHPHMIEELASALESTGADFVYSDMNLVDDLGRIIRQMRMPDYSFKPVLPDSIT